MILNRLFSIIVFLYLFAPINYIPFLAFILVIILILSSDKISAFQINLSLPFLILAFVSFLMMIVNFQFGKEIVEFYKWTSITLMVLFFDKKRSSSFLQVFQLFSILSFILVIIQQFFSDNHLVVELANLYADQELVEKNFIKGYVRSTGFNEGPGHVGVLISFNLFIFFVKNKWGFLSNTSKNALMSVSLLSIAATASKGVLPFFFVLNKRMSIFLFGLIFVVLMSYLSIEDLYYLERLTNSASGEARVEIWSTLLNKSISEPITVLIGNARINSLSTISVFDSDWVYLYFTKGLLGLTLIMIFLYLIANKLKWSKNSFIFIMFLFILIGFANPAFTDIKFGVIYIYLVISLIHFIEENNTDKKYI